MVASYRFVMGSGTFQTKTKGSARFDVCKEIGKVILYPSPPPSAGRLIPT